MFEPRYHITNNMLANTRRMAIADAEIRHLPLPPAFRKAIQTKADIRSIHGMLHAEGTALPMEKVAAAISRPAAQPREKERAALNYATALAHVHQLTRRGKSRITRKLLAELHGLTMKGILAPALCGSYTKKPLFVSGLWEGGMYVPPDPEKIPRLMNDLLRFVQDQRDVLDPLILAGLFYRQLLIIHPFEGGNARVARLIARLFLADLKMDALPLLDFEAFDAANPRRFGEQMTAYVNYFEEADRADFTDWLDYFSDAVCDSLLRLEEEINAGLPVATTPLEPHHELILKHIDTHGSITDRAYARLCDRAKATRTLDFNKLIALDLIERHGSVRSTHYKRKQP